MLPYLQLYRSRGRQFAYYRRAGLRWRIPGEPGSPAFLAAYQARHAAFEAAPKGNAGPAAGGDRSLAALITLYRASPEWRQLKPATRTDYDKAMGRLRDDFGTGRVAGLKRQHVRAIRDRYAFKVVTKAGQQVLDDSGEPVRVLTARRANKIVTMLSILCSYAIELGWIEDNPAAEPKRLATGEGYRAWTMEQVQQLEAHAPELRPAIYLALSTGQRSGDLVRMTRRDYDGRGVRFTQAKTGAEGYVPLHPAAKAALDAHLAAHTATTLLARADGQPWATALQFQTYVSKAIRAAGLRGLVWHGLRPTNATWLAEAGASDREIMAVTGHTTGAMVSHYTRSADQKRRATSAIAKLSDHWTTEKASQRTDSEDDTV